MNLVKAKRDEVLGPLAAVSGIIERRHTLPILSNVLIDRADGGLSFLATDIEIQITAKSALAADGEARAVTVGARKLLDILRALPDGAEVTLSQQEKRLLVRAGKSRFSLQTLPAEDFPRLAAPAGEVARFALPQKALRRLLGLVQYAMAQQDIRYYLNGLLMVVEDKNLRVVATDGQRLAEDRLGRAPPGSHRAAQDGARARQAARRQRRPGEGGAFRHAGRLQLRHRGARLQAGGRQVSRLHPGRPDAAQEQAHPGPRG